ncbi:ADP-ribose pyrophosphatase YjhB (NUDIX family) [Pontibacter ummariensis]|uniref:ADP-ribose pyrophosphatase YjhB, NUDIX family n=1 Tax=Pontibacter ummariensis TaxID=1610492 RepID=A0A239BA77_9BACT|nr:NUDIX domain-containing protein [Pontibacter ummariensis]PRY16406.1 ADP-ribose pyrophosphatase YjhB (NUDIX family) [Pontibacter ummariensis]SNS04609.1 ADP-ribose pyrophosphatase YjhB, NUDIX family [Pontibacter ummariensis]
MVLIDKLAWIEIRERKILSTRSKGKDTYYIPGGKREAGESDQEALLREIQEELNVNLDAESLQFFGVHEAQAHGHPEGVMVKMQCYTGRYQGEVLASAEIAEVVWLRYQDRDKISPVDKLIFDDLKQKGLID